MKRVAIHSRKFDPERVGFFRSFLENLQGRGVEIAVTAELHSFLSSVGLGHFSFTIFQHLSDIPPLDFVFSVGGDGTLLEAVTMVRGLHTPIVGINTGRLGFLATIPRNQVHQALDYIANGQFSIDERILIQADTQPDIFEGVNFGLNEFTILKRDTSSMIIVHTYINGEFLNSYWADGLIIATPTGSTGYSLSVGGPVVIPHSNNFIIAPVSPHNLNVRPLIVSDDCVITFRIEGRSKNFLVSLDSRSKKVDGSVQITVRKCDFTARLVKFPSDNFFKTLRSKLNWGLDTRN